MVIADFRRKRMDNQNNKNNPKNNRQGWGVILITTLLVTFMVLGFYSLMRGTGPEEISYDKFLELVDDKKVEEVRLGSSRIYIVLTDEARIEEAKERAEKQQQNGGIQGMMGQFQDQFLSQFQNQEQSQSREDEDDDTEKSPDYYTGYVDDYTLAQKLDDAGVEFKGEVPDTMGQMFFELFVTILLPLGLTALLLFYVMKRMTKGSGMMGIGKSNAKMYMEKETGVTFQDVAGEDEAKESLQEVVDFLHNPGKYSGIGAKLPKGALLVGPPGTGKTLLAKAVAGEAKVPFFSLSGSAFVEMYVGVGASRVRDLFKQAQQMAPCIVFIDEIDAVARRRGSGLGGGHDEREQTLNQLLVEMDGFGVNEGIIVMAATNRKDILDPAILRPGRFDRNVIVGRPDVGGREEILKVHAKNKPLGEDVDLKQIAQTTAGFTGADLENLLNEAAILAAKDNRVYIQQQDIRHAFVKVGIGAEKKSRIVSEKEKRITAYHEAGHAILFHALPDVGPVYSVSIIPTGGAGGYTMPLPEHDEMFNTKGHMLQEITVALGGRVAEEEIFDDITTGASQDIKQATAIAKSMITKFGMSERLGLINYDNDSDEVFIGRDFGHTSRGYGEKVAGTIDEEVKRIIDECYLKARAVIQEHHDVLDACAKLLLEKEKITRAEFEALFEDSEKEEA